MYHIITTSVDKVTAEEREVDYARAGTLKQALNVVDTLADRANEGETVSLYDEAWECFYFVASKAKH